jgi:hypothetical protein
MTIVLNARDIDLLVEALAMSASRHESSGHVTKGHFRYEHDEKAQRMRALRIHLMGCRAASGLR